MKGEERLFSPKVLVAPLDWGLGHATRCIPVIHALIKNNCTVILAGDGKGAALLKTEFPQLQFLYLPGYNIGYKKTGIRTTVAILQQIPKIKKAVATENQWLKKVVEEYGIDAVISDNRYGLHHPDVYSVFITHQLHIQTPFGKLANLILQRFNYKYINRFNQCWVPDVGGENNLGGALSHPAKMPAVPVRYIGPLTRFAPPKEEKLGYYILILLSGPEPQRTLLEDKLLLQIKEQKDPVFFVRGLPGQTSLPKVPYQVNIVNHLPTAVLQQAINNADLVVARSGYSTVMDLMSLNKKSILIPTPGQTEQQYLAKYLMKKGFAFCIPQAMFQLRQAVALAKDFKYCFTEKEREDLLQPAVEDLINQLKTQKGFEKVD